MSVEIFKWSTVALECSVSLHCSAERISCTVHTPQCAFSVMSPSLQPYGLHTSRLLCPWDSPGRNTGVGCHFLLQAIFPTRQLNPGLRSPELAGGFFTNWATREALLEFWMCVSCDPEISLLEICPINIFIRLHEKMSIKFFFIALFVPAKRVMSIS